MISKSSNFLVTATIVALIVVLILTFFPFHYHEDPFRVDSQRYVQGEYVPFKFARFSFINSSGSCVRELNRIESNGTIHEMQKVKWDIFVDRGRKTIQVYYRLPPLSDVILHPNTYNWTGVCDYKVFGIWPRNFNFSTETFQVVQ
jgi:hypothetical protein